MIRRSGIKPRRDKPRRKAPERITHQRAKPKAGADPSAIERRFIAEVRAMPCLVCGNASTFHHVTGYADKPGRTARDHMLGVPLCAVHHQKVFDPISADPVSVEGLGHQGFFNRHGIDLRAVAEALAADFLRRTRHDPQ